MPVTATPTVTGHRPAAVLTTFGVLVFLGVSATAGGIAMVLGSGAAPPDEWLDQIPLIDSWVVPGMVLGVGFGLGSLITAYGMIRRYLWSWLATMLIGLGHVVWIALELTYLPEPSALQVVYGAVGIVLLLLPWHPAVRGYFATRPDR
jgi:hypothetical protein